MVKLSPVNSAGPDLSSGREILHQITRIQVTSSINYVLWNRFRRLRLIFSSVRARMAIDCEVVRMARPEKPVAENRKARHDYFIDEVVEAGIVLTGTEVKSMRMGRVNLRDSFARVVGGEIFLINSHIAPYDKGNRWNHEPYRDRKLLLHKKQIRDLAARVKQDGMTLVPVRMYFDKRGRAKVLLGVARGKKQYDKRHTMHEREVERHIDRVMKDRRR